MGVDFGAPGPRQQLSSDKGPTRRWPERLAVLAILAIQLVLISPSLMPPFPQINPFDEAKYVVSGNALLSFEIRDLAHGPLVALFYAPLHLVFGGFRDWFVLETWAGRILLFTYLFLCTMYLGKQLRRHLSPYVLAGALFVTVPFIHVVHNQSDALFAGLSALILAQLIRFQRDHKFRDLTAGSALLALAVMSRAEAVILLGLFPVLALGIAYRRRPMLRVLLHAALPALAILLIYLIALRWSTGNVDLGFRGKSYNSFELNQPVPAGVSPRQETSRLYGTAEENGNSVLRAILRNPRAFTLRLWVNAHDIPGHYLNYFEKKQGPALLLLMFWGVVRLAEKKQWMALGIIGLWSLEPWSALPFVTSHIVSQLTHVGVLFSALGATQLFDASDGPWEHRLQMGSVVALAAAGLATQKLAIFVGGFVLFSVLALRWLAGRIHPSPAALRSVSLLMLVAAALILRTPFPFPNYPPLGDSAEEQAIHYLEAHVQPGSRVIAPFPGPAVAARTQDFGPGDVPEEARSPQSFLPWMRSKGIAAIYLDQRFKGSAEVYDFLDGLAGKQLRVVFTSTDGRIRILLPPG